jgi:chromosome partitioning protein
LILIKRKSNIIKNQTQSKKQKDKGKIMGKIIAFTNQKGGVGKTTSCVNISAALAKKGFKVLILDLDPQGNASSGVAIEKRPAPKTIYNVIDGEIGIEEAIIKTKYENLSIIPATVDLAGAEYDIVHMINREFIIKRLLTPLKETYDVIAIDCPPSLGQLTVNALTAADSIIIPIQCEFYALEGVGQLMNTVKLIRQHINNTLDVEGVILTMKNNQSNLVNEVSNEIKKFFAKKVFDAAIPRNIKLAEAPSHGMPICYYDPKSAGGLAYDALTDELIERLKKSNIKKEEKQQEEIKEEVK